MAPQMEPAVPVTLDSVGPSHVSRKLRVAGLKVAYDTATDVMLLVDRVARAALLVDCALCVGAEDAGGRSTARAWMKEEKAMVKVIGYLEEPAIPVRVPTVGRVVRALVAADPDPRLVLKALLVVDAPELDLAQWNVAIREREEIGFGGVES
ncbi:hypothetical protein PUNSTDRAFT_50513 [Punctularia strigosozonata HHB-11173 SS5]|uniref:uncharacterized protein n=1 Tax=Punctularia strigosozonata (strain HHB-11173) TaxID=741275 RepID=UPI0004416C9E|nr:uncharacterized protein PUNSTDRAFT_50513 [Punctularia strigosozonata HHB-11173 SS5]EIN11562.1 hypothetical protein PUNSTDRAFT_50513 [Punctularia strigosozonata HHB-11173 SS5]